jgi:CysZ protein
MNPAPGVRAFSEGFATSRHPSLRHYFWAPALLSLVIIGAGLYALLGQLPVLSAALLDWLPDWLDWLELLLTPLAYVIGVLGGAWAFALLAVLIASPFLGAFSAAVERLRSGAAPTSDGSILTDVAMSFRREARKLLYHLPRLAMVFVLTLIPVINLAAPLIWFAFGAWTVAVQFVDYPSENRRLPFGHTLDLLGRNRAAALGFGACASLALMIPLLNFLLIPVAVAGGTLLWRTLEEGRTA